MTHPIRPPGDDLVDVQTTWGTMPRWKARALAVAEIQTVLREARSDTTGAARAADAPSTLAEQFKDATASQRLRDAEQFMTQLKELEARMDALLCRERARQALLDAEALFTPPDDPDATRH